MKTEFFILIFSFVVDFMWIDLNTKQKVDFFFETK